MVNGAPMIASLNTSVLAIDGGGTRCRLAWAVGDIVTHVETGPANVTTDFHGAVSEILQGLEELSKKTGMSLERFHNTPAFIGLAGAVGDAIINRLKAALPFQIMHVADDRPAAVRGALGTTNGVVAHCGTGSFLAAQNDGMMRFVGGWGPVLGDEASAQWVGRQALHIALECEDGLKDHSDLTRQLLSAYGGAAGLVEFASTASPTEFGAIAPQVTQLAKSADVWATHVMQMGAGYIAATLASLGWTPDQTLCLTGGIGAQFLPFLPTDMQTTYKPPVGTPLGGAVSLAQDFASEL